MEVFNHVESDFEFIFYFGAQILMLAKTHFFEIIKVEHGSAIPIIKVEHGSAIPIICFGFDFAPFYNKNPLYGQFYEYLYNVFSPYFVGLLKSLKISYIINFFVVAFKSYCSFKQKKIIFQTFFLNSITFENRCMNKRKNVFWRFLIM